MAPVEIKKVLCILYDGGSSAKEEAKLLGTVENALGLKDWFKDQGIEYVVTSDKEGPNSAFQRELPDTDVLITTPFWPGYLTAELMDKAPKLKLCMTAGVGSDHIDLKAAIKHNITVAEVTGSNVTSVAEHVVMLMLNLVRNYVPAHVQSEDGKWDIAAIARNAYDIEGKVVGTVGCGRIGYRVLQRLQGFDCKELLWFDYTDLPADAAKKINARRVDSIDDLLAQCDVVTINCPLTESSRGMFDEKLIAKMKPGSWLVNTARGAICKREAVVKALESGHLRGYAGDVWDVQPAPVDHPWRKMTNPLGGGNGMTPHYSGTTLDAQKRYAEGTKEVIRRFMAGEKQEPANLIVAGGGYASKSYDKDAKV